MTPEGRRLEVWHIHRRTPERTGVVIGWVQDDDEARDRWYPVVASMTTALIDARPLWDTTGYQLRWIDGEE